MISADSMGTPATDTATTGTLARADLAEASGAAMSATQPSVVFTINDSGHDALLYAIDSSGADRGVWRVTGARNDDWESIAVAPCGLARRAASCVYIGDTGDNEGRHPTRAIYRVPEPPIDHAGSLGATPRAERLVYQYANGPRDVEAMYVAPNADVFLISKRRIKDPTGRLRPALVYRLPHEAWESSVTATAELADSLPIVPGSAPLRQITDAALSPDGRHVAVRTYTQIFVFAADSTTGRIDTSLRPAVCNVGALAQVGEGITWTKSDGTLLLTNEGDFAPVYRVRCPLSAP